MTPYFLPLLLIETLCVDIISCVMICKLDHSQTVTSGVIYVRGNFQPPKQQNGTTCIFTVPLCAPDHERKLFIVQSAVGPLHDLSTSEGTWLPFTNKSKYHNRVYFFFLSLGQCSFCGMEFLGISSKSNRLRHEQSVHLQIRKFKCIECGFSFKRKAHLREHISSRHPPS